MDSNYGGDGTWLELTPGLGYTLTPRWSVEAGVPVYYLSAGANDAGTTGVGGLGAGQVSWNWTIHLAGEFGRVGPYVTGVSIGNLAHAETGLEIGLWNSLTLTASGYGVLSFQGQAVGVATDPTAPRPWLPACPMRTASWWLSRSKKVACCFRWTASRHTAPPDTRHSSTTTCTTTSRQTITYFEPERHANALASVVRPFVHGESVVAILARRDTPLVFAAQLNALKTGAACARATRLGLPVPAVIELDPADRPLLPTVRDASLRVVDFESGLTVVGAVALGDSVTLDVRAGAGPNSGLGRDASLRAWTSLPEGCSVPAPA